MEKLSKELLYILNEQDFCFTPEEMRTVEKALGRFSAYEDTELEPEDIVGSIGFMSPVCVQCDGKTQEGARTEKCGYSHGDLTKCLKQSAHLSELARAEQDGRLVVLPCKLGDTVYVLEPLWYETFGGKESKCRHCEDFFEGGMGDPPYCRREEEECLMVSEMKATLSLIAEWLEHGAFRKTVFLTRQDAEAALSEMAK